MRRSASLLRVAVAGFFMLAAACIDSSTPSPAIELDAAAPVVTIAPTVTEPPPDAQVPDGSAEGGTGQPSFASGMGAGSTVSKSGKYTLITKTGGSPGGHGISHSPQHTGLSGVAAGAQQK